MQALSSSVDAGLDPDTSLLSDWPEVCAQAPFALFASSVDTLLIRIHTQSEAGEVRHHGRALWEFFSASVLPCVSFGSSLPHSSLLA